MSKKSKYDFNLSIHAYAMQSSNEKQNEELKEFVINQEKVVKLLNAGLSSKKRRAKFGSLHFKKQKMSNLT